VGGESDGGSRYRCGCFMELITVLYPPKFQLLVCLSTI
jgi:hypothetical protein